MSVIVTITQAVATKGGAADLGVVASVIQFIPDIFGVSCNGNDVGHECPAAPDVLIEPGDTWGDRTEAVAFAGEHVDAHEARQ